MTEDQEIRVKCLEQAVKIHIHNGAPINQVVEEMYDYIKTGNLIKTKEGIKEMTPDQELKIKCLELAMGKYDEDRLSFAKEYYKWLTESENENTLTLDRSKKD